MRKITVKVKPNAKTSELVRESDGSWHARLKAPPAAGKANAELVVLVAGYFDVPKSRVRIKSGHASRTKLVEIDDGH
ncbi:MAG TPA: DUF167 domain-containing protein [Woeseiaceae bacterium]